MYVMIKQTRNHRWHGEEIIANPHKGCDPVICVASFTSFTGGHIHTA